MNKKYFFISIIITLCLIGSFLLGSWMVKTHAEEQINIVTEDLNEKTQLLNDTKDKLLIAKEEIAIEIEKSTQLNKELEAANIIIADLKTNEYEFVYIGDYKLTHYCTEQRQHICGTGTGLTATGTQVSAGRTVAVDPRVIPYGTEMYIEGYGWRVAEDCGGAVDGNHIDIAVDTHSQAISLGTTTGGVWVLVKRSS